MAKSPVEILKQYWGFDSFRGPQERIIADVMSHIDLLAIMPTGGGKSICFQVPALALEGVCVVISPLIALMIDQVDNLKKRGIKAAAIHSGHSRSVINRLLSDAVNGHMDILYMSPERLISPKTIDFLRNMNISFLAVDEAHCISEWGYDFRPAYLEIQQFRAIRPDVSVLALTASAIPVVQNDIQEKLAFSLSNVISSSLQRPNIGYHVLHTLDKEYRLIDICQRIKGTGIVYLNSRTGVERIAYSLKKAGIKAEHYHAGLDITARSRLQKSWLSGHSQVIVATNAFGMGIDKADVRFVIHVQLPMSLEAYYQESGRAGRDGFKSYAVLLYNEKDKLTLTDQFNRSYPEEEYVKKVYKHIAIYLDQAAGSFPEEGFLFDFGKFVQLYDLERTKTYYCIRQLVESGWIYLSDQIYQPSKLKFIMDRRTLYDLQLTNPKLDLVTKALLRTYEGLFTEYVSIQERVIANILHASIDDVITYLTTLDREKVIRYIPIQDKPKLFFTKMRIKADKLSLDHNKIEFRKERHLSRINHVIQYVEHTSCREHVILNYFGQRSQAPCGHCDLCLKRAKSENTLKIKALYDHIKSLEIAGVIHINDLMLSLKKYDKKTILDQLHVLESEERIRLKGQSIIIPRRDE